MMVVQAFEIRNNFACLFLFAWHLAVLRNMYIWHLPQYEVGLGQRRKRAENTVMSCGEEQQNIIITWSTRPGTNGYRIDNESDISSGRRSDGLPHGSVLSTRSRSNDNNDFWQHSHHFSPLDAYDKDV